MVRIAVIGGGISGLAAAHRIRELDPAVEVRLFEASSRLGGVLGTVHEDGYQVEWSADNFITTYPWGLALCRRIGLEDELTSTCPENRRTLVVRKGRLHALPDGFLMMAPTRLWPMALTPLLTIWGKLRAGFEYFIPPRKVNSDESVAAFVRRRFGREVFERLVEPLVSGVYAADMERLSLLATLPRFREIEQRYGSLIRGMQKERALQRRHHRESGARYSMFVTLRNGLERLIGRLAEALPPESVRLNHRVLSLRKLNFGWEVGFHIPTDAGLQDQAEVFDGIILAIPAFEAARLVEPLDLELSTLLASIRYEGTAILALAYDRQAVRHPLRGMGCVVPAIEHSPILAVSFSSQKYLHRAPAGKVLLRVFVGGARHPDLASRPQEEIEKLVLPELTRLFAIDGMPEKRWFFPWPRSMPQYDVGHLERVGRIRSLIAKHPGLALAGNAYQGVGIPHCIHSGESAAESLLNQLVSTDKTAGKPAPHPIG
ncbi:MAG: protoporphyrinogen oxidase [Thermoguttaceae bacterium]|nr:protoporphyrinogen oxidase [Thermoguttaceae bacterium]MDW8079109.1 protoporphyrinogen oxidase [Thermoguttaceae bacterium]